MIKSKRYTQSRIQRILLYALLGIKKNLLNDLKELKIVNGIDYCLLDELCRIMKKINIYIWCNKKQILDYLKYFVENKKASFEILTWIKTDPTPLCGGNYLIDKEFCLYFRKNIKLNTDYDSAKTWWISKKI